MFLPSGFQNVDLDAYGSWSLSTAAGAFGNSSQSAYFNNFDIYSNGGKSDLRFFIDLSTPSLSKLKFDVAFAQYSTANSDTMVVLVSTDCGANFTQVYLKGGSDLATAPDNTNSYVPSSSEWRTDSIDLSSFAGNSQVIVAFRNIGHYGNNLYLWFDSMKKMDKKSDIKQDKALMKGKPMAVKKAFMKADKVMDKKKMSQKEDTKKDIALMKKIESKKGKK